MKRQCVRCGVHLRDGEKLWCRVCIDRVNEELEGKADREWRYYFRHHLKQMEKEKADIKLRELKRGTIVAVGENKHIMEFLGVDGMYGRRKSSEGDVIIMGHANQKVSEYGEIVMLPTSMSET